MILELDCGNSFIKWRLLNEHMTSVGWGVVDADDALIEVIAQKQISLRYCRMVSVRNDEETFDLASRLRQELSVETLLVSPTQELGGVKNGYDQFDRLGLDRWVAVVGAFSLSRRACLVIDLGTAVTSDFVSDSGEHLGGFICPGVPLMRSQLRTHTRRTRYDALEAAQALRSVTPGRSTAEAVERGCLLMLQGFVLGQIEMARSLLGKEFDIFLTGGDAPLVASVAPAAKVVPDLVFIGLAIACPIE
ncbi:pantothenate kinase [Pseudomonas sp. TTU2014-080ASC]|uniref:pantothenate kinase n=1 Tax=Pseudomonas sp. TTU2014-080ASC TaxID=1729724 RepID=UPI0007187D6B|nr:pantothenate kinase [Pseudomonas sp. TTU2014-080ASC]KRW60705.1 type III pantothenate kinase [Pseudomonas sp. TTU2014-080ASC]